MRFFRLAIALLALVVLAGCSSLGAFNTVILKDRGARTVATGVAYGSDERQKLDVYAPSDGASKGVVVFFYGGSWSSGSRGDYGFVGKALASRGYMTVIFDYRLVPEIRYPAFVQDSAKAVAWVRRHIGEYGGDPGRIMVAGHSAGAYNMMMVTLAPEFLQAEGLSPSIVKAAAGISGPYDFLPFSVDVAREAFKGTRDLRRTQPVNRAGEGPIPPILLLHGRADETVEPRNTESLAAVLRRKGRPAEFKFYDGVDHVGTLLAISRPLRGRAPVLDDLVRFLDSH